MGYKKARQKIQTDLDEFNDQLPRSVSIPINASRKIGNKIPMSLGTFLYTNVYTMHSDVAKEFDENLSEIDQQIGFAITFNKHIDTVEKALECDRERIDQGADRFLREHNKQLNEHQEN